MRQNGRKKKSGGVWAVRIVSGILMILLALCVVFGLVLATGNLIGRKTAGGFRCFTVLTGSMEPDLTEGDLVIALKKDADQIAEGDIIVFYPSEGADDYLIHQVTEKVDNYEGSGITCFFTSGTKVKEADGFLVDEDRVVGTVDVILPRLGYIARFLMIRWYCVIIYILMLFLMLWMLAFWLKYRKPENDASKREERLIAESKKKEKCLTAKDKKRKDSLVYKKAICGLWISLAVILVAAVPVIYVTSKDAVKENLTQGEGLVCAESFALTMGGNRAEGRNIRAVNTGNRDAIVMAVLTNEIRFEIYSEDGTREVTGAEIIFDYSGVTSIGEGDNTLGIRNETGITDEGNSEETGTETSNETKSETESVTETNAENETENRTETNAETGAGESYITAVYQGENLDDPSDDMVFRIYLNTVITYTDLTVVRKDYTEGDREARDLFDAYQWTFDDASSTETEAFFYCNYIVTPGDHTGELIDRVELASGADGTTGFDYSLKFELKNRQEVTPVGYLFGTANGIKGLGWSMEAENICGYYDTDCGRSNYIFWETTR